MKLRKKKGAFIRKWWRDLSVAKKLYAVVGVMALLIAFVLLTLLFAMNTLSSLRSFVGAEGSWSKAQKDSVQSLYRYVYTGDQKYYNKFYEHLYIPLSNRSARLELEKPSPNIKKVQQDFEKGNIHPHDVPGVINILLKFNKVSYIAHVIEVWEKADILMSDLILQAENLHEHISAKNRDVNQMRLILKEIDRINTELTELENEFSSILGEASRWLEFTLMVILVLAVLTVEITGLYLTISFSRNLSKSLAEIREVTFEVGKGNFSKKLPIRSKDELGQLAEAINKMSLDLENSIGKRKQAEDASHTKTLFLANMSHEIRTPLSVILGLSDILKDPNISNEERTKYLETMERTGKNLNRIINDILDISKVETGHLNIELSDFSIFDFFNELKSMMLVKADKDNNKLIFRITEDVPAVVRLDRTRLKQILVNLISNSLKFTRSGSVRVSCTIKENKLYFEVKDTGKGMSVKTQQEIFRPFSKFKNSQDINYEGAGLGLVLSKRLAQDMGGDVELIHSKEGKGTTFMVSVQLHESDKHGQKVANIMNEESKKEKCNIDEELIDKKVLIVEDSLDNQLLLNVFLTKKQMKVDFARNGKEGINKALEGDFDIILMDMQMPIVDGYEATQYLRERGYFKPIVALTAHAMKEDKQRCLNAGCDDYLTKPINYSALYEAIHKYTVLNKKV